MSAEKHTQEPWFGCCNNQKDAWSNPEPHFIFAEEGEAVLFKVLYNDPTQEGHEPLEPIVTLGQARANSRRMTLCVNFCAEIPSEQMDGKSFNEAIKSLYEARKSNYYKDLLSRALHAFELHKNAIDPSQRPFSRVDLERALNEIKEAIK